MKRNKQQRGFAFGDFELFGQETAALTSNQQAFVAGYYAGAKTGELSYGEAEAIFPEMSDEELQYAANGSVDGAIGDEWRLLRITQKEKPLEPQAASAEAPTSA